MKTNVLILSRALIAMTLLLAAPAALANETETTVARESIARGKGAFERGDYATARAEFLAAYGVLSAQPPVPPNVLLNLAGANLKLQRNADAATFYRLYREHPTVNKKQKEEAGTWFDKARAKVAELTVEAPAGTELTLSSASESRSLGRAPLSASVFVEPGEVTVAAKLEGKEQTKRVHAAASGSERVVFEAAPKPKEAPAGSGQTTGPVVTPPKQTRSHWSTEKKVTVIAGASVTGVLAITAVTTAVLAAGQRSTATDATQPTGDRVDAGDSANSLRTISMATAWPAIGVGALTGLAILLWPNQTAVTQSSRSTWTPTFGPGQVGLSTRF